MQTLVEMFNDLFGEAIEVINKKFVVAVSAPRHEALVHLPTMFLRYEVNLTHYNVEELPKVNDKKNQIVIFSARAFDYKKVKKIVEGFFNNSRKCKTLFLICSSPISTQAPPRIRYN